jgi:tetratricopeptide (TPR) repeat protein
MKSSIKYDFLPLIFCLLLIAIAYLPTFSGEFILDDRPFVKENPYIQRFHGLVSYLTQEDGISHQASDGRHSGYYRPLLSLSYTLDLKMWGMNPAGFRFTNLLLHLLICLLLYAVLRRFIRSRLSLCLAVLLFGLHPANTETVSWVSSRNNILVALFSLAVLYCHMKGNADTNGWWRICALVCFGFSLLSKEFAVMILPILICYDQVMVKNREPLLKRAKSYIPFLALILGYFVLRSMAVPEFAPPRSNISWWQSIYYTPFLIMVNLRIVLLPYGLHNFMITYPEDYLGGEALAGFIGLGMLAWALRHFRQHSSFLFAVLAFLLALFPILNIIPTSATSLVSMRWLYFPMIFLVFTAETGIRRVMKVGRTFLGTSLLILIVLYFGIYTFILNNNHWKREEDFFRNEVVLFDNRFYESDYARMLHRGGDYQKAIVHYKKALKDNPKRADTYINFASLLVEMGKPDEALQYLRRAEPLYMAQKDVAAFYNNKGVAHFRKRAFLQAIEAFQQASSVAPNELSYLNNLGLAYLEAERYGEAIDVFENCLRLEPNQLKPKKHLSLSYARSGEVEKALKVLKTIPSKLADRDPSIHKMIKDMSKKGTSPVE